MKISFGIALSTVLVLNGLNHEAIYAQETVPASDSSHQPENLPNGALDTKGNDSSLTTRENLLPNLHIVQMKLAGPLTDLQHLQAKIVAISGIQNFVISKSQKTFAELNWVEITITYEQSKIRLNELKEVIRKKGYIISKVADKYSDQSSIKARP